MNLRELFATFGLDFDATGVTKAEGAINKLWAAVRSFGAAIASTYIVRGIWNFVTGLADAADNIGDLSARSGVASGSLQRIGAALSTVGIDLTGTAKLLETMNIKLNEAGNGGKASAAFRRLGVDVRGANGEVRDSESVFLDVTDRISHMGSAAERTAAVVSIFGGRGRALAGLLAGGNSQIRDMISAMGGLDGITEDVIQGGSDLETQQTVLDFAFTSIKSTIARELLPAIIGLVTWGVKMSRAFLSVVNQSHAVKAAIVTLGSVMVFWAAATIEAWGPPVLTFAAVAGALLLVVAIVDDIITLFQGGDSELGRFIDSMYGVGASRDFVDGVKLAWTELSDWIGDAATASADYATSYGNWADQTATATGAAVAEIGAFWGGVWEYILGVAASIGQAFTDVWSAPMAAASVFWEWIVSFVEEKIAAMGSSISGLLNRATGGLLGSAPVAGGSGARVATAAPTGGGGGTVVQNNTSVPVTIVGNPSAEERRRLQATIQETLDARDRAAAASLVPIPG